MNMESLANGCAEILQEEEQHYSYAMQLATSVSLPMVLMAAIRLDLFEIIAEAGHGAQLSPSQIAAHLSPSKIRNNTNTNEINGPPNANAAPMVDRMLRLLASYSVLTCSSVDGDDGRSQRIYGLTPVAKYFVRSKKGVSLGPFMELIVDKVSIESWYQLGDAVVEGGVPFDRVHGTNPFEYTRRDPRLNEVFNKGMINNTTIIIDRILDSYKGFEHVKTLVDVGGGLGVTLNAITTKWSNIRGINFDLPHVIQHAPVYPGVDHVAGDMFETVPEGDAILVKRTLHDWDDEHCLKVLKNCYKALPENGKVIVMDALLPMIPDTSASVKATCQCDLLMMSQCPGGKERTQREFLTLATAAGFRAMKLECFVCNLGVMEFYK